MEEHGALGVGLDAFAIVFFFDARGFADYVLRHILEVVEDLALGEGPEEDGHGDAAHKLYDPWEAGEERD